MSLEQPKFLRHNKRLKFVLPEDCVCSSSDKLSTNCAADSMRTSKLSQVYCICLSAGFTCLHIRGCQMAAREPVWPSGKALGW